MGSSDPEEGRGGAGEREAWKIVLRRHNKKTFKAFALVCSARLLCALVLLALIGCGTQRPVLYPNDHLKRVGRARANRDVEECSCLADEYVKSNGGKQVVGSTVTGGAVGGAIGAAGGAVTGDLGRGAAIGGATGATAGLIGGLFKTSRPSPIYKNFVERCLRDKGYEPIGWR